LASISNCPICRSANLKARSERLRDSDVIGVVACNECSHVFLDDFDHVNDEYFVNDEFLLSKKFVNGVDERLRHFEHENQERLNRVGPLVTNKRILEFGCGAGALMEKIKPLSKSIEGIERTKSFRERLKSLGFTVYEGIEDADGPYDVALMFHVLEHLSEPVQAIRDCVDRLAPGGLLYIEVPNINDALLKLYDVEDYHRFHFFKDHLHYFSRMSLQETIRQAGVQEVTISGHSRFGLANHLYWLKEGRPGGHMIWNFIETPSLFREYARALAAVDMSDSLVAQIRTT